MLMTSSQVSHLTKGYSGLPDSARLVHACVPCLGRSDPRSSLVRVYVPSDANVADLPSRDMTLATRTMEITRELISHPCPVRFQPPRALDDVQGWLGAELEGSASA
eukprot:5606373-Prymnesium_polylepis.1